MHDGRVAVVTGAASGIGRASVERMLAEGASVVAVDRDEETLGWTKGVEGVVAVAGDVTSEDDNAAMVAAAIEQFGRLDALVLNAGVSAVGGLEALSMEAFDQTLEVNVRGPVLGIRAAVGALQASGSGAIVIVASVSGLGGDPGMWAYNTSKGAAVNLVRAMSLELAARGIRVNCVCPGPIRTGMTAFIEEAMPQMYDDMRRRVPLQRWGEPSEVGQAVSFLASPAASFVTGAILPVDGGITANTGQFLPPPLL